MSKTCDHDWVRMFVTMEAWGDTPPDSTPFHVDTYTISVCRRCKMLHWITPEGLFDYTFEYLAKGKLVSNYQEEQ